MDISFVQLSLSIGVPVLSIGVTYGMIAARVNAVEKWQEEHKNVSERLASIETKIDLLLTHLKSQQQ